MTCTASVTDANRGSIITCSCGWVHHGSVKQVRRAYYQHNPESEILPLPDWAKTEINNRPPTPTEVINLQARMATDRIEVGAKDVSPGRRTFPDIREQSISTCPSCGSRRWQGFCPVRGCWTNLDNQRKDAA